MVRNAVLEVVKRALHGTQCGTRGYSRALKEAHAPDGAAAGTTVVGASVGEGVIGGAGEGFGGGVTGGVGKGVGGGVVG
jgi:hypothetical protein